MLFLQKACFILMLLSAFGWVVFESPVGVEAILHQEAVRAGQNP